MIALRDWYITMYRGKTMTELEELKARLKITRKWAETVNSKVIVRAEAVVLEGNDVLALTAEIEALEEKDNE